MGQNKEFHGNLLPQGNNYGQIAPGRYLMFFDDPAAFEDYISPVAGSVNVRPAIGSSFNADISLHKLDKVGLFSVKAGSFKACKEPQKEFYGLTIPLSSPFTISDDQFTQSYQSRMGHILSPGNSLDLTCKRDCHFLAGVFFSAPLNQYMQEILQTDSEALAPLSPDVLFNNPDGNALLGSVVKVWAELNRQNHFSSETSLLELQDDLLASLILYIHDQSQEKIERHSSHFRKAEEYICANLKTAVTRDALASISGRSIRSLSRNFQQKYGMGPMAFLRRRRLEAAYLDLLGAEPESITVTQVASSYGFSHFGKFAVEYKTAFGESPSTSLAKK